MESIFKLFNPVVFLLDRNIFEIAFIAAIIIYYMANFVNALSSNINLGRRDIISGPMSNTNVMEKLITTQKYLYVLTIQILF